MTPTRWLATLPLALLLFIGGCGATASAADVTIRAEGCIEQSVLLPPTREPVIAIENRAAEPMVFTIPTMNRWVALGQGERADFELPRYIMGRFDFFCLSEAEHTALAGGNPFLCVLEPAQLQPVARSAGLFEIAPHTRLDELTAPMATPAQ